MGCLALKEGEKKNEGNGAECTKLTGVCRAIKPVGASLLSWRRVPALLEYTKCDTDMKASKTKKRPNQRERLKGRNVRQRYRQTTMVISKRLGPFGRSFMLRRGSTEVHPGTTRRPAPHSRWDTITYFYYGYV